MDSYNAFGWTILHEACYRGNVTTITKVLEYGKKNKLNLIEMKTEDDFKMTPILAACLGGQVECIKLLVEGGANIEEKLQFKQKNQHGLVEIAFIKQDIRLLTYLYTIIKDISATVRKLMVSEENDDEIRSSVALTLEKLSQESVNSKKLFNCIIEHNEFPRNFVTFLRLCLENSEAFPNISLVMINIMKIAEFRKGFCDNGGIKLLMNIMDKEKQLLVKRIEALSNERSDEISQKSVQNNSVLIIASLGQAICEVTKYENCIQIFDNEGYSEKFMYFTKLLFDFNEKCNELEVDSNTDLIAFEEYMGSYMTSISNLLANNDVNKNHFSKNNLFDMILNLWCSVEIFKNETNLENSESIIGSRFFINSFKSESMTNIHLHKFHVLKPNLLNLLQLAIVDCLGSALQNNDSLKSVYLHTSNNELSDRTSFFIYSIIDDLEASVNMSEQSRIVLLKCMQRIAENDYKFQNQVLDLQNPNQSRFFMNLRNLIRKTTNKETIEEIVVTLWMFVGSNDYFNTQDRKVILYRTVGIHRFVDGLPNNRDKVALVALDAIQRFADSPPHRDAKNVIVNGTEEVGRAHAIPALVRLLKTNNEQILFAVLKAIKKVCVYMGYRNNERNQSLFLKLGAINDIFDLLFKKNNLSKMLKAQILYTLSTLATNNFEMFQIICSHFQDDGIEDLTRIVVSNFINSNDTSEALEGKIENLECRINAGMALCGFFYKNDAFKNVILRLFGKFSLQIFENFLDEIAMYENEVFKEIEKNEFYLKLCKAKCLLAFQMGYLHSMIEYDEFVKDPRAKSIKILIDTLHYNQSTLIRATAAECLYALVSIDKTLTEPIVSADGIEILCKCIEVLKHVDFVEIEIGCCSMVLGCLTENSPEARRRTLKILRKVPFIMNPLKYYNEGMHPQLLEQWIHFKDMFDTTKKKQPVTYTKKDFKLPFIRTTKTSTERLNKILKLKNLKV